MSLAEHDSVEELRRQVESLRQQLEQAQRMATIGELASTTTHEFNNLLTTIINYARMGLRHKDEPNARQGLTEINDAATRATKVASSVLAMARNRTSAFEPVLLSSVLEDTLALIGREFQKHRIALETEIRSDLPMVNGSSTQLQTRVRESARQRSASHQQWRHGARTLGTMMLRPTKSSCKCETQVAASLLNCCQRSLILSLPPRTVQTLRAKAARVSVFPVANKSSNAHNGRIRSTAGWVKGTAFTIRIPACTQSQAA